MPIWPVPQLIWEESEVTARLIGKGRMGRKLGNKIPDRKSRLLRDLGRLWEKASLKKWRFAYRAPEIFTPVYVHPHSVRTIGSQFLSSLNRTKKLETTQRAT
jgi:hypothetical protein